MSINPPLILVVEDNLVMRLQICQAMKQEGYAIIEASNGEEAIEACQQKHPDIVLLDAIMPVMDGFTCCTRLRSLPGGERISVLMVTALEDRDSVDRAFAVGAIDYVTKPIHWAVLRQRVRRLLRQKRAEEELYNALAQEKQLREFKSRFVSMASHELRTPMTKVLLTTNLIKSSVQQLNDEQKIHYLNQINLEIHKMNQLLDDVLFISKSELVEIEINLTPINIKTWCQDLIEDFRLDYGFKHNFIFDYQGDYKVVELDEKFLQQILTNLLLNAIKYSPYGGKIQLNVTCNGTEAIFQVKDEGIGIPELDHPKLFELFYRASNVGNIPGTGLGLAIIKNAIELHKGFITFESQVNVGSSFTVYLPMNKK